MSFMYVLMSLMYYVLDVYGMYTAQIIHIKWASWRSEQGPKCAVKYCVILKEQKWP